MTRLTLIHSGKHIYDIVSGRVRVRFSISWYLFMDHIAFADVAVCNIVIKLDQQG